MHKRRDREERCEQDEPSDRTDEVERPLEELGRLREARGRQPDERDALDRVELRVRPEHLEQPRDDVDLDVGVL